MCLPLVPDWRRRRKQVGCLQFGWPVTLDFSKKTEKTLNSDVGFHCNFVIASMLIYLVENKNRRFALTPSPFPSSSSSKRYSVKTTRASYSTLMRACIFNSLTSVTSSATTKSQLHRQSTKICVLSQRPRQLIRKPVGILVIGTTRKWITLDFRVK